MENLQLLDIADDLLILNRNTIENLFKLENSADCIALYLLYYKTAKWQKTDTIKANDNYVQKSLKWGRDKTSKTKQILKDNGLIEIIQRRNNGKIGGWFIKIHYIISKKEQMKVIVEQEVSKQEALKPTCGFEETNALRNNIKCLKKEIEMLKEENNKLNSLLKERPEISPNLEAYKEIVNYMNVVNEHHRFNVKIPFSYKYQSKATQKLINARLREGYNIEEFKDVIWWGYKKFVENEFTTQNGESSFKYFRPSTLFSSEHFEAYLNEYRANTQ